MPTVHLRTVADFDLPKNSEVTPAEVDDPYEKGATILVMRSIRDDPLARMHVRKQIDTAQFSAGREYQRVYAIVESGAKAMDFTREAVDGGRIAEPFSDARKEASDRLNGAYRELGPNGSAIVRDVLGQGLMIAQVAANRGFNTWLEHKYIGMRFRECLETLAILWGYAQTKRSGT